MGALPLLVLAIVFLLLVLLYLGLTRINEWRLSDASRRASIARWLQQRGKDQSPPTADRILELLNDHLENCVQTRRIGACKDLGLESVSLDELKSPSDQLYRVIRVSDDDDKLVTEVGVSLHDVNTEWAIKTTKYGVVFCNVFFHRFDSEVTMEFNKVQDNVILFGVHQLEIPHFDLSVTVTSPAMKDSVSVGNMVSMVIQEYLSCVKWSNETVVARAKPTCWESFTPKKLVSKEIFFADDNSSAAVAMDTSIGNSDSKETSVIDDSTLIVIDTPSSTRSVAKETTPVDVMVADIKDTPTVLHQSNQFADHQPLPSLLLSSHDSLVNKGSPDAIDVDDHVDLHGNNSHMHPNKIQLDGETESNNLLDHISSHSVPCTPMKPHQSSSESSDYPHQLPVLPRRSRSYEHLEEVGVPLLTAGQSTNNSGSGGFRFHGNVLASVGSSSDVLEDNSEVSSYVSGNSTSSTSQASLLVFEFQESGITRHIAVDTTLDKVPRFRNATKLHISNDHVFVASYPKSTIVCGVCSKKIHRILGKRNAYLCRDCKMCTHKSCHGNVKEACPNSSYHHMTINYAESSNPK